MKFKIYELGLDVNVERRFQGLKETYTTCTPLSEFLILLLAKTTTNKQQLCKLFVSLKQSVLRHVSR